VTTRSAGLLARLERARTAFGGDPERVKLAVLAALERARLATAGQLLRLHDTLCFLRAYPDGPRLLARVERMLAAFERRPDLARHRAALRDSGIAGTAIEYRFFWPTARWLARRWGDRLSIVWKDFELQERLLDLLPALTLYGETPALDEIDYPTRQWLARLKGLETDAAFLVRRFAALAIDEVAREKIYDQLDPPLRIAPGPGTPSRTHARHPVKALAWQRHPLVHERPDLARALRRPPLAVRAVAPSEGQQLIDLARVSMVTRSRDLDAFSWGDARDVRLADCGEGLQFAVIGVVPERRLMMEAVYAFLTLKNGIPIGYVLNSALYHSAEIAYNVFETWRGAEAGVIYARALATVRHLFGSDSFTIYPYQLGEGNDEAIASGAWWFYHKLGFRPRDPEVRRRMNAELALMRRRPSHRSSPAVLHRLARANLYYHMGRDRDDVIGLLPLPAIGLAVQRLVAERFGSDRERGEQVLAREAGRRLGLRSVRGWSAGERLAWQRWSPLVQLLDVARWNAAERQALVEIVRAKGGRRESEFALRFDRHRRLRAAIRALALREDKANP
jgi:hypothetical protein